MRPPAGIAAMMRSFLNRRRAEDRMNTEFDFHIGLETAQNIARGMNETEARRAALVAFGGTEQVREEMRQGRAFSWLGEGLSDVRIGIRQLFRQPAFTLSVILTLALSIGATTAVFSLVRRVLLDPLPYPDSGRIMQLATRYAGWKIDFGSVSQPELTDLDSLHAFESLAPYRRGAVDLALPERTERLRGLYASASLFRVLRSDAAQGRVFTAEEDRVGGRPVALLTHQTWQRLGADSSLVGKSVRLNAVSHTIIGVLNESFDFANGEVVVPLRLDAANPLSRGSHFLAVVGRLASSSSIEQAQAELKALSARLRRDNPNNYAPDMRWELVTRSLRDSVLGNAGLALRLVGVMVVLVLLVACANVANLLLARAHRREREFALRFALGARRGRIVRQLVAESLLTSLIGAALGLVIAILGTNALLSATPGSIPRVVELHIDGWMLFTATVVACGSAMLFGLLPALRTISRGEASTVAKSARGASVGGWRGSRSAMTSLVSVQLGFATLVVICAGLLFRSYTRLNEVHLGFAAAPVLAFDVTLPESEYSEPLRVTQFFRELNARLEREPGIVKAGGIRSLPLRSGTGNIDIEIEGHLVEPGKSAPSPLLQVVTPGYFTAMQIPLEQGRLPELLDDDKSLLVAWVNSAAAKKLWPGESPVGKRFHFYGDTSTSTWFTVAGVVGNVRTVGVQSEPTWEYYIPHAQVTRAISASEFHRGLSVVVRTIGDPATFSPRVRTILRDMDSRVAPAQIESMETVVSRSLARPRFLTLLLAAFAVLAALLAMIGVYGILSYAISTRAREIGIRMALGAPGTLVIWMMTRDAVRAIIAGIAVGSMVAIAGGRVLEAQLYGVKTTDPMVFTFALTGLLVCGALAALVPATGAVRTKPTEALRAE